MKNRTSVAADVKAAEELQELAADAHRFRWLATSLKAHGTNAVEELLLYIKDPDIDEFRAWCDAFRR